MNFVDSHLEMISYVSKSTEFLSRSLKDATRLENYTQRARYWNVNTQESYKVSLVSSLKRKRGWGHHLSLETNQTRVAT